MASNQEKFKQAFSAARARQGADLGKVNDMLEAFAAEVPQTVEAYLSKHPFGRSVFGDREDDKMLVRKMRCELMGPHDFNSAVFGMLNGFQTLLDACARPDVDVALTVAVCHFKPGPDKDGLYKIRNPEAVVIARLDLDAEKSFSDSQVHVYKDEYTGAQEQVQPAAPLQRILLFKPLKLVRPGI
ncbi:MAG: hypothetical protein ACAH83_20115 [Alphaproteobacteria bacterium]